MKKFKKPKSRGDGRPLTPKGGRPSRPNARPGGPRLKGALRPNEAASTPQGRCVVGIHAVEELLEIRPKSISKFMIREKYTDHPSLTALFERAQKLGVRADVVSPGRLEKIASTHQGVIAFSSEEPEIDWTALETAEKAVLVALDEVEDPHNLGAVMRTAWLLGARAILTTERRSAQLSPAVSKVAQGAVEHVPVVSDMALPQQLEALKKHGFWILGLSHKATQGLFDLEIPDKVVWVLGSESSGLRKSVEGTCDDLISIPQLAPNASYNVSVAAAVALGETFRQRQK